MTKGPLRGIVRTGQAEAWSAMCHHDSDPLPASRSQSALLSITPAVVSSPQLHPTSPFISEKETGIFKLLN